MFKSKELILASNLEQTSNDWAGLAPSTDSNMTYPTDSKWGHVADFNGTSGCIKYATSEEVHSVFCWVKLNALGNYGIVTRILNITFPSSWTFRTTNGILEFRFNTTTYSTGVILTAGEEFFVGFTTGFSDGEQLTTIWVNGVAVKVIEFAIDLSSDDISVGCQETALARRFLNGQISHLSIFSEPLSQPNVQRVMLQKNPIL